MGPLDLKLFHAFRAKTMSLFAKYKTSANSDAITFVSLIAEMFFRSFLI